MHQPQPPDLQQLRADLTETRQMLKRAQEEMEALTDDLIDLHQRIAERGFSLDWLSGHELRMILLPLQCLRLQDLEAKIEAAIRVMISEN